MNFFTWVDFPNMGDHVGLYVGGFLQYENTRADVLEYLYNKMIPSPVQITQVLSSVAYVAPSRLTEI